MEICILKYKLSHFIYSFHFPYDFCCSFCPADSKTHSSRPQVNWLWALWFLRKPFILKEKERVSFISHMSSSSAVEQIAEWQQHMLVLFSSATWHLSHTPHSQRSLTGSFSVFSAVVCPAHSIWKSRRVDNTDHSLSDP